MSAIVVSLDFELRWGVADVLGDDPHAYRRNIEGVREVVPALLELFASRGVGATWAIVGSLACEGWDEWLERAPRPPRYADARLRPSVDWKRLDPRGRLHFAPDLVRSIARAPRQELGSHTFTHAYLREPGCTDDDARADARAVSSLFRERFAAAPRSFVFPRNQVARTDVLRSEGIVRWRENPRPFFWRATAGSEQSPLVRALRLSDSLLPLGTRRAPAREARASHFVRYALPGVAWRAHLRRLAGEARALRDGEALHVWWHPHNLGADVGRGAARTRELLDALVGAAPSGTRVQSMEEADPGA